MNCWWIVGEFSVCQLWASMAGYLFFSFLDQLKFCMCIKETKLANLPWWSSPMEHFRIFSVRYLDWLDRHPIGSKVQHRPLRLVRGPGCTLRGKVTLPFRCSWCCAERSVKLNKSLCGNLTLSCARWIKPSFSSFEKSQKAPSRRPCVS